jgi:hypothetical protein
MRSQRWLAPTLLFGVSWGLAVSCGDDPAPTASAPAAPEAATPSSVLPEATDGAEPEANPKPEPAPRFAKTEPGPVTKRSAREHPLGFAWVMEPGEEPAKLGLDQAEALGFTIVSLGDDWVPYIFTDKTAGRDDRTANDYAQRFRDLANERTDADGDPLDDNEHNYLELYGIPPTLSVIRDEWTWVDAEVKPCLEAGRYDVGVFKGFERESITFQRKQGKQRLSSERYARSQLVAAMKKAKLAEGDYEAAAEHPSTKQLHARWRRYRGELDVIGHAQVRFGCERLFETSTGQHNVKPGVFDGMTTHALAAFERKHNIRGWGHFTADNLEKLGQTADEATHARLVRVLTERTLSAAGVIEDGSAAQWQPEFRWTDSAGKQHALGDEVTRATDAVLEALDMQTPEAARAALDRLAGLNDDGFESLLVAIRLPPAPEYYADDMRFDVHIDRGDVWYEFPYDEEGKRHSQPRARYPHLTLYATWNDQRIPLVHWRTTIGSWRSEVHDDNEYFAYKNSDVGDRVWKNIVAAPAWIPPDYTPTRSLLKKKHSRSGWKTVVNYDETGPGYQSAYGLVAAYHIREGRRRDGTTFDIDNQIRTHGSVDYMSIMRRYSHGCHRLYNMSAVRMFSFILQHREFEREGQTNLGYRRQFEYEDEAYTMAIDTRGYRYKLAEPIPVKVTEGRVRGSQKAPIAVLMKKPGVEYDDVDASLREPEAAPDASGPAGFGGTAPADPPAAQPAAQPAPGR